MGAHIRKSKLSHVVQDLAFAIGPVFLLQIVLGVLALFVVH